MDIRQLKPGDEQEWIRLRMALWPDGNPEELVEELPAYVEGGDARVAAFVVERPNGLLGGLMEVVLRMNAEGCLSSPVACIEAWYVDEDLRKQGLSYKLMESVARWARVKGCAEVASSCVIENESAIAVHEALGFEEVDRLVHFIYELEAEG